MYSPDGNVKGSEEDSTSSAKAVSGPCTAIDVKTGAICGQTEGLYILDEFRKLYEARLRNVDEEPIDTDADRTSMKLQIMSEWVKDLDEQNVMLVRTVEELEHAACTRVTVLEDKLMHSSSIAADSMTRALQSDEDKDTMEENIEYYKLQLEKLKKNEKKAQACRAELEEKLADLNKKVTIKDETIKKYIFKLQNLRDNLKSHPQLSNQIIVESSTVSVDDFDSDTDTLINAVECALVSKDLNIEELTDQLRDCQIKLDEITQEKNDEIKRLRIQLDEQHKRLQTLECQLHCLEKESMESREVLTMEVAEKHDLVMALRKEVADLEEQCRHVNMQTHFKDDIIKEMRRELRQARMKDTCSSPRKVRIKAEPCYEEDETCNASAFQKDKILSYLSNTKILMQQEKKTLLELKSELEKILDEFNMKEKESESRDGMKNCIDDEESKLTHLENTHQNSCSPEKCNENQPNDTCNSPDTLTNVEIIKHFRMMEEFRVCTVEAQAATEDLREEMNNVIATLHTRHHKFTELSEAVHQAQEQLIKTRQNISETINRLESQGLEQAEYFAEIAKGELKLKDIKNEINQARSEITQCINTVQDNVQQCSSNELSKTHTYGDLLVDVVEEVEQIVCNLEMCQSQNFNATSELFKWKEHLSTIEVNLSNIQKNTDTVLLENTIAQKMFCEKAERLDNLKDELDCAQTKMQDALESILNAREKLINQLQKDDTTNEWKCHATELQNQVGILEKKIVAHRVVEGDLRRSLRCSEMQLKKSMDLLESFKHGHSKSDGSHLNSRHLIQRENIPQSCKSLQSSVFSMTKTLQELTELKNMVCQGSSHLSLPIDVETGAKDFWNKYSEKIEQCLLEFEELQNTLISKDTLLNNKDEIIRIQKDSIAMTQTELKDLHQKLQDKIDVQGSIISQYEKEKKHLIKQSELQTQTIANLQDAVVEAKRKLDQMANKSSTELLDKDEAIRIMSLYLAETQNQYNECFTEAAEQGSILEVHRDAIDTLQKKINRIEYDACMLVALINLIYHFILAHIQEQLQSHVCNLDMLRIKTDTLVKSKKCLEEKYMNIKQLWHETDRELRELKSAKRDYNVKYCQTEIVNVEKVYRSQGTLCEKDVRDSCTSTMNEEVHEINNESSMKEKELRKKIIFLSQENEEIKKQLCKYQLDFEILEKEMNFEKVKPQEELKTMKMELEQTKNENERLIAEIGEITAQVEVLVKTLQTTKEKSEKLEKQFKNSEISEKKIESLKRTNEILMKDLESLRMQFEDTQIILTTSTNTIRNLRDDINNRKEEVEILRNRIAFCENIKNEQARVIENLEAKLEVNEHESSECLCELNSSKEMLCVLHDRISSLKSLLKEKSDMMATLEADYEMLKNSNVILTNENEMRENKDRENICELKKKLKEIQLKLCHMEENYLRATEDFNKSQVIVMEAAKREVDLQETITTMEKDFLLKLTNAEGEEMRLQDLVEKLNEELGELRNELSVKNTKIHQARCNCKSHLERLETLQQDVNEMHKCLWDLRQECQIKSKSLASISAELSETAASRSQLCNESHHLVSSIRTWMQQQKKLVENLASRLKTKQEQLVRFGFEKKALLMALREFRRANGVLTQRLRRTHLRSSGICKGNRTRGVIPTMGSCRINSPSPSPTSTSFLSYAVPIYCSNMESDLPNKVYSRLSVQKCSSVGPIRSTRRCSAACAGNSWWFPKMEYLTKELRKNNEWWSGNKHFIADTIENQPSFDENRDCGYQSSTSK
ncbi:uncharacterized protein PFB0145c isoform X2 [Cephus cinctus]|uniref:Uncharacterized protein PFB0145c isoform X2 n=1 Tax=Cephus cinctus TaxID=211228 RepID=A0AAJ7RSL7_CEPCN|nr:uncharacterized protein PFB0145c isoform X2 [Cephus cinctus]